MFPHTLIALSAFAFPPAALQVAAPPPPPIPVAAPAPDQSFPAGAEVLAVDGEPLGVLARVEITPGGERILHIRRPDGTTAIAPATVASRGERAIVLEWTRAEFETPPAAPAPEATPPTL
ncbi:hypothetical protein GGQ87_001273 [Brevundimonas alba]|uniref:PRC-barrel domain-containing protein n=1 Tax=Brevundimonas alba TaxID=74314 RepID=A0A7X6BNR6_9CAUL|nr:hypothetical protein [Brevundimonas alba]NJC41015.1 hypothetical protein [Brevundimonas alba]